MLPDFAAIVQQARCDGLFVLPGCLDPSQKHPAVAWKKFQTRYPSEEEIAEWVTLYPRRNGVYLTGPVLGRFVVDIDNRQAAEWVCGQGVPKTQVARTRKGYHIHFRYPDNFKVRNSVGLIHLGVDIRGFGGVAVAVGSIHESGFRYAWASGRSPKDVELAPAPAWLLAWLCRYAACRESVVHIEPQPFRGTVGTWARRAIDAELAQLRNTGEGQRNAALARAAYKLGQLVAGGEANLPNVRASLYMIAGAWPNFKKSKDTVDRCLTAGMAQPRGRSAA